MKSIFVPLNPLEAFEERCRLRPILLLLLMHVVQSLQTDLEVKYVLEGERLELECFDYRERPNDKRIEDYGWKFGSLASYIREPEIEAYDSYDFGRHRGDIVVKEARHSYPVHCLAKVDGKEAIRKEYFVQIRKLPTVNFFSVGQGWDENQQRKFTCEAKGGGAPSPNITFFDAYSRTKARASAIHKDSLSKDIVLKRGVTLNCEIETELETINVFYPLTPRKESNYIYQNYDSDSQRQMMTITYHAKSLPKGVTLSFSPR